VDSLANETAKFSGKTEIPVVLYENWHAIVISSPTFDGQLLRFQYKNESKKEVGFPRAEWWAENENRTIVDSQSRFLNPEFILPGQSGNFEYRYNSALVGVAQVRLRIRK